MFRKRLPVSALLFALLAAMIAWPGSAGGTVRPAYLSITEQDLADAACGLPHQWLLRTWRGWRADRGPEIVVVPREPDFVGSGLPHVGPWDYVQHVPMLWYGPGQIAAQGPIQRPVTSAGIAPTQAALLNFPFKPIDGLPMREAVLPASQRSNPPKLIVVMIWDAAGMNVLNEWEDDWPFMKSLISEGTWYENATVGSSPTSTAQIHATIGTGAFPRTHGLVGHRLRIGGELTTPWAQGPAYIIRPTLADLYDRAMGNEPVVGTVGTVSIHLGMMGHGKMWAGGDRDIGLTRSVVGGDTLTDEGFEWNLPTGLTPYFKFLPYANDVPGFQDYVDQVDAADGKRDGMWRDNDISQLLQGFDTPARIPYENKVVEEIVKREGFGADATPDLLYVNFKEIDYISHIWTMNSLEMRDAVQAQDAALKDFVGFLDKQVGRGQWAMVVTSDHGAIPDPKVSGAFNIATSPIAYGVNSTFDKDGDSTHIVEIVQPVGVFIDERELEQNGGTLEQVAAYIAGLTKDDVNPSGTTVPASQANDPAFQAVFPSAMMENFSCLPEAGG